MITSRTTGAIPDTNIFLATCTSDELVGNAVYIFSNDTVRNAIADASDIPKSEVIGIIIFKADVTHCTVQKAGLVKSTINLDFTTLGIKYLSQTTPGQIISTIPISGLIRKIGYLLDTNKFIVDVSMIPTIRQ